MSEVIIGIDLGTTQSAVAVVDSGFPILLADEQGRTLTPSAVWYSGNGEVEVGQEALRRSGVERVHTSVKSLMGRRAAESGGQLEPDGRIKTAVGLKLPEEVSAEILSELKRVAEHRLETTVTKAVVTVPAYFHDGQRAATKKAGELAGLEVVRILSEPTAAALSYGLDRLDESSRVAVFDLGGGTFDVSVLEMREGVFEVSSTSGDTNLGGDDFDEAIAGYAASKLDRDLGELDPMERVQWISEGRRVKHVLSESDEATFRVPFAGEVPVSSGILLELMNPFLDRMESCCRRAMLDAGVNGEDLTAVVMVGGSSRIPLVKERVARIFGQEPDLSQHPDEAIARGAAIQAGILAGTVREVLLLDVTPLSLGIETMGGLMNVLISRNTTIPCKAGEMFTNAVDGQESMGVRVLQGERELARDNWELGSFEVQFEPNRRGQARVGVEFRIDADGILSVLARDVATGKDTVIEIGSAAVDVQEAKVEQMISESVEFAFEDMNARVFEEARLKAEELLPAVGVALEQAGEFLNEVEIAKIQDARARVEKAIEERKVAELKVSVEQLDEVTETLAAMLVQKATEALFSSPQD
ncbi:Hsp70 family protein [bacterium]|nr:Hsp70 family protein [bacterium]